MAVSDCISHVIQRAHEVGFPQRAVFHATNHRPSALWQPSLLPPSKTNKAAKSTTQLINVAFHLLQLFLRHCMGFNPTVTYTPHLRNAEEAAYNGLLDSLYLKRVFVSVVKQPAICP